MRKTIIKLICALLALAMLSPCLSGCYLLWPYYTTETVADVSAELINEASTRCARGIIKLDVTFRSGLWDDGVSYTGSAVIVGYDGDSYYALTCAHCVTIEEGFLYRTIKAIDAYGAEYTATPIVIDESLDLAYISFKAQYVLDEPEVIELADSSDVAGETVISIGNPHGLSQVVTAGEMLGYKQTELVDFLVLHHTAIIGGGSSGGALFNSDLELIGINFAGLDGQEYSNGYAIPIEKVREFLTNNDLM